MTTAPVITLIPWGDPQWWQLRFDQVSPITFVWEGGEVNMKEDPGGHTNMGITQAVYSAWLKEIGQPDRSVSHLTKGEARQIYYDKYWTPTAVKYDLFPGVDLAVYDAGVNSGPSRGIKWLIAGSSKTNDHVATVKGVCKQRLSFVEALKTWKTFGKGWARRIADIEVKGVAMAAAYMAAGGTSAVKNELSKGAKEAEDVRKTNTNAATKTGAAGTATGAAGTQTDTVVDPNAVVTEHVVQYLLYGLAAIAVVAVVYFLIRTYVAKVRRDAYKKEMANVI